MMGRARILSALYLASFVLLSVASCENEAEIEAQIRADAPKGFIKVKVGKVTGFLRGTMTQDCQVKELDCVVTVIGKIGNETVTRTFGPKLRAKGDRGDTFELECADPVVMQMPADVRNLVAKFSGANGVSGELPVESGLTSIQTNPLTYLHAEAGNQLFVIRFPEQGMPDGSYDVQIEWDQGSIRPIGIKPLLSGWVRCNEHTFLPPVLPAVSSFADVPEVMVPVSADPMVVNLSLGGITAGDVLVNCSRSALPLAGGAALAVLALACLWFGARMANTRSGSVAQS